MAEVPDFRVLFESAPGLNLVLTPDLHIAAVTDAYLRATMTKRDEVVGRYLFNVFPDNPADPTADGVSKLRASLERVIQSHQPDSMAVQKYDIRRPAHEGGGYEERYWSPINCPVLEPDGRLQYIIHRVEDVTEFVRLRQQERQQTETTDALRRRTEQMEHEVYLGTKRLAETNEQLRTVQQELATTNQALQVRNHEVERANRMKSEFLASMSHELRTPLNAIVGFSDLLSEQTAGFLNSKQQRFVGHIQQGARHLLALINDILDLSKVEAGRMQLQRENVDVGGVVAEVLTSIRSAALAKHIQVQSSVGPGVLAHADRIRFRQILLNLLSNAVKFTPDGGKVSVEAICRRRIVTLSVSDTGIGIPPEEQESIFDAFHQVGISTRGVKEGTGLGLAITKRLVEEHGGRIWVESTPGKGTRLTFTVHAGRASEESEPEQAGAAKVVPHGDHPLILVVDDEPSARELLASWLEPAGYEVVTASSFSEALTKAAELVPDAITLDMLSPGKAGWDALYALKKTPVTASIPIIVVTVVEKEKVGLALGAAEYLVKPVDRNVLLETIRRHIGSGSKDQGPVLVVDDEATVRELLKDMLESAGYQPMLAANGKEALETLGRVPVSAILLDLVMPEMDGFELLLQLKEQPFLGSIPVLVLTGKDLTESETMMLRHETLGLFRKGQDWKRQLLADLHRAVGAKEPNPYSVN